jgi:hypothetical protein
MDIGQLCTDAEAFSGSTPNAVLTACVAIGVFVGFIWSVVDPRFSGIFAGRFPVILGGLAGGAVGALLIFFFALWCDTSGVKFGSQQTLDMLQINGLANIVLVKDIIPKLGHYPTAEGGASRP